MILSDTELIIKLLKEIKGLLVELNSNSKQIPIPYIPTKVYGPYITKSINEPNLR